MCWLLSWLSIAEVEVIHLPSVVSLYIRLPLLYSPDLE